MHVAALRAAAVGLLVGHVLGCSVLRREVGINKAPATVAVTEITPEHDRERLEALAVGRNGADPRDGYRIGPDDLLEVRIPDLIESTSRALADASSGASTGVTLRTVSETPMFTRGFRVSSRGDIELPLIGQVHAEGLTPSELEAEIARRLRAADILRKPEVTVQLAEYRSGVVAVMGSVEKPGLYPITRPGACIADLIWAAGGPTKEAGRIVAFAPGGTAAPIRIDLELLLAPAGADAKAIEVRVRPGDVISIAPAGNVLVDGWVEKPGSYPVTRGLTLIGAVAAAGGNHFAADREHATVKRNIGPREQDVFTVDLDEVASGAAPDIPLADGDIVRVPPSPVKLVPWGMWKLVTSVVAFGAAIPIF